MDEKKSCDNCKFFKSDVSPVEKYNFVRSRIGICTQAGIDITEAVSISLCTECKVHKMKIRKKVK
jgi:hypothetical protein